jgi:hypothetical protein
MDWPMSFEFHFDSLRPLKRNYIFHCEDDSKNQGLARALCTAARPPVVTGRSWER